MILWRNFWALRREGGYYVPWRKDVVGFGDGLLGLRTMIHGIWNADANGTR